MTVSDPGREFAFAVTGPGDKSVNTWRYVFAAKDGGTDVIGSFELANTALFRLYRKLAGPARGLTNVKGMRTPLERLEAVVESDAAA